MAYTARVTHVTGYLVTASDWNESVNNDAYFKGTSGTIAFDAGATFASDVAITGTAQATRMGVGVAPHATQVFNARGTANAYAANIGTTGLSAGTSFGLEMFAGTNASDFCAEFRNQANTLAFTIRGDGLVIIDGAGLNLNTKGGGSAQWSLNASGQLQLDTSSASNKLRFDQSGCLEMGAPTGTDKGVGTINVSAGVYLNNTAYTNPDYSLEHYFSPTHEIVLFADSPRAWDYPGLMSLSDLRAYMQQHLQLPRIGEARDIFERADLVLEKLEEYALYLTEIDARLTAAHIA